MKTLIRLLWVSLSCLLVNGCNQSNFWGYTMINQSQESFSDVIVSYDDKSWPLPNSVPGGATSMGVIGQMPKAVDVSFISKDGIHHTLRVVIPDAAHKLSSSGSPEVYLVIKNRDMVIATEKNPWEKEKKRGRS